MRVHVRMCMHSYVHVYRNMYVRVGTYIHMCMCMSMHMYTYTYKSTGINTCISTYKYISIIRCIYKHRQE